jgi:hypothetical protein
MTTITLPRRLISIHAELIANAGNGLAPSDADTSAGANWARGRRYKKLIELQSMGLAITRKSGQRGGLRYHPPATAEEIAAAAVSASRAFPDIDESILVAAIVEMSKAPALSANERIRAVVAARLAKGEAIAIA